MWKGWIEKKDSAEREFEPPYGYTKTSPDSTGISEAEMTPYCCSQLDQGGRGVNE